MRPNETSAPRELGGDRGAWNESHVRRTGRELRTDTHCNTEGYPGSFKPLTISKRKEHPVTAAAFTLTLAVGLFLFTWCACYLAGCVS